MLPTYGNVLHVDVGLYFDDLELEANEKSERPVRPGQAIEEVGVLIVCVDRYDGTVG